MAIEKELKLSLDAADVEVARRFLDAAVAQRTQADAQSFTLENVYFDTADRDLARARIALRLRRTPHGWLQTLKTAGHAVDGLHARGEWEIPVAGDTLELPRLLAACDDAATVAALTPCLTRLAAAFRTDFTRTTWQIVDDGTHIEAALDIGAVRLADARDPQLPIREIELELKTGDEAVLLAFAARLRAAVPGLRPDDVSKAARGYRLLAGRTDAGAGANAEPNANAQAGANAASANAAASASTGARADPRAPQPSA